jgi:hypothetical protein
MTPTMLNEVRICFIFCSFVDDFDLSVSSATRNRADQPIRPSDCARQCPEKKLCGPRAFTRIGLWSYYVLGAVRRGPTRRSAIATPRSFEPKQERIVQRQRRCLMLAWGIAPGKFIGLNTSAESALHFGLSAWPKLNRPFSADVVWGSTNPGALPQAGAECCAFGAITLRVPVKCGAAAPAIAKAASRATGRQES